MKRRFAFLLAIFVVFIIPGLAQERPFLFVMFTDTQLGMYESNKGFARETANFEFVVAAVNRLKPAFAIVLGDLVNREGDSAQIQEFLRISRKIDSSIPVYYVPGNHDVGAVPTPEMLAAYRKNFGRDYYAFTAGPIYGIVLNSTLISEPQKAEAEFQEQDSWLKRELETAKKSGAPHIIVFQHHPYFLENAEEPAQYSNMPLDRRRQMLSLLHRYGVRYVFAGHIHKNNVEKDGDLEMVAIGPVSIPFGDEGSGIALAAVTTEGVQYRYYSFAKMPDRLEIK